jgi:hypothetical protein
MYARAPLFAQTSIPTLPSGVVAIEDGLALVSDRLMHAAARAAEVARLQLAGALRQLRGIDLDGSPGTSGAARTLRAHLALVSIALDRLSANVKTACEVALGGGADLDRSRAHVILTSMRENLQHDANELSAGTARPREFYPEFEVSAERLVRIMRDQVQQLAPEHDEVVRAVRERAH